MTENRLTMEQEMDVLFGRIVANLFEAWKDSGPRNFYEHFRIDPLYTKCLKETGKDRFACRIQDVVDFVLKDLIVWDGEPFADVGLLICSVSYMEDESDEELPMTITVQIG